MKRALKNPTVPPGARETVRHAIVDLLRQQPYTALEISAEVHIPQKDVYDHLEHIRQSSHTTGARLQITPAECLKCGFIFSKRDRLSPPSRCPLCRREAILEQLFTIRQPC